MKNTKMPITPIVIQWCRRKAGFSIEAAARKIGRPREDIEKWENGTLEPTLTQLRKASKVFKFPTAVFFLPEPPRDFSPLRDFRTLPRDLSYEYSPELSLSIREAQARQEWTREYLIEEGAEELDFVGSSNIQTSHKILASAIREHLSITVEEHKATTNREDTLQLWKRKAEQAGVFIFQHRKIDLIEARGFVLSDKYAPFIFINANDAKAGQLFTLLHEIVHLWINETGISNLESENGRNTPEITIEKFCNAVASEVLVDTDSFKSSLRRMIGETPVKDKIEALSSEFKVSEEVIARKMLQLNLITSSVYSTLRSEYQARWREIAKKQKKSQKENNGWVSPYRLKVFNIGYGFTQTVLSAYSDGFISGRDTSLLLGVKVNNLKKLSNTVRPMFGAGR